MLFEAMKVTVVGDSVYGREFSKVKDLSVQEFLTPGAVATTLYGFRYTSNPTCSKMFLKSDITCSASMSWEKKKFEKEKKKKETRQMMLIDTGIASKPQTEKYDCWKTICKAYLTCLTSSPTLNIAACQ